MSVARMLVQAASRSRLRLRVRKPERLVHVAGQVEHRGLYLDRRLVLGRLDRHRRDDPDSARTRRPARRRRSGRATRWVRQSGVGLELDPDPLGRAAQRTLDLVVEDHAMTAANAVREPLGQHHAPGRSLVGRSRQRGKLRDGGAIVAPGGLEHRLEVASRAGCLEQVELPGGPLGRLERVGVDAHHNHPGLEKFGHGVRDATAERARLAVRPPEPSRVLGQVEVHAVARRAVGFLEELGPDRPDVERGLAEPAAVGDGDEANHSVGRWQRACLDLLRELLALDLEDADELADPLLDVAALKWECLVRSSHRCAWSFVDGSDELRR